MRVAVTREELIPRVEALGHDVVLCQLVRVEPLGDEPVDPSAYDWVIVTSPNGARELARRLTAPARHIAAIGPGTAGTLREHGIEPDLVPRVHTQEGLRDELPPGKRLLAGAEGARQGVIDADFLPLYRTIEIPQEVEADVALLMSGSAARALLTPMNVVAIGPQTAAEARRVGHDVVAEASSSDLDGLVEALASLS